MSRRTPEQEALAAHRAHLAAELAHLASMAQGLEARRAREAQVAHELAAVDASLAAHQPARGRVLPMLEQIRIASPCTMSWQDMVGDERVRYCGGCEKNVFNLSAMLAHEAEALLAERAGELCVRFYQRADGTVMTSDCAVGVKKKQRKKLALAVAGAGAMAAAAFAYAREQLVPETVPCTTSELVPDTRPLTVPPVMGEPARIPPPPEVNETVDDSGRVQQGGPHPVRPLMGAVAPPPHRPRPLMGKPMMTPPGRSPGLR